MTHTPGGRVLTELTGASQADEDLATAYRELYSSHRAPSAAAHPGPPSHAAARARG
ncbi:hypothetical protein ABZ920_00680 [Streptomyces sp. NPDC046831]|uniref:hypothetical protein n=1 Tax=Streptomyces sp. NPDC046831 TaxID=3154805 RepID=UPI0033E1CC4E